MRKAAQTLLESSTKATGGYQLNARGQVMAGKQAAMLGKNLSHEQSTAVVQASMQATHYYIKFAPQNQQQLDLLKTDTTLVLYPFPLDSEVSPYSGSYRDPSVPADRPTYQYCAVPVSKTLPNVPYTKLEDLYIPNETKAGNVEKLSKGSEVYTVNSRMLAQQSLFAGSENTNADSPGRNRLDKLETMSNINGVSDLGATLASTESNYNGRDWRPHGRLTVYDEVKNQTIGVEGIKVRARRWFTTYSGYSDANGNYTVDGWFTRPANYWLDFERYEFSVNDHRGGPQEINGPKIKGAWNVNFEDYNKFCSTIFRAAYHYYYKDIQGLRRPPQNSFWKTQVKLAAFNWEEHKDNGDMWAGRNILFGSLIHIYRPQRSTMNIYATTIHELAHASHWNMSSKVIGPFLTTFGQAQNKVPESWATGVEWVLTKMEYPQYLGRQFENSDYTNLVMDLIDTPNNETIGYGINSPLDQVEEYTIVQIEESLRDVKNFYEWKDNLRNNYENNTEQHLDALFDYWNNY